MIEPTELSKTYDPKVTDNKWYVFWEKEGFFKAHSDATKPSYTIVMPPPNVTGVLHMGHALVNTLQDILIRWKRMSGFETLWIPGTDHAGIATQTVVEKHLLATEGKRRDSYLREEFLHHVWQWKATSEKNILSQLKSLGCSCDWSRLHFTMDASCNQAVKTIFKHLFDEGLIYRGHYLVNWDPLTQTALADDEVEYEERQSSLWYFKYPLADQTDYILIATTRPETLLGDTGIAVSPKDPRYQHLIGKKVCLPILNREIPIVSDHRVDPNFGSGAVKITPAHDFNDYQTALEHHLEMINIFTSDGHINEQGGPFKGMKREAAREAVVKQMEVLGLLEKVEPYSLRVGVSYRSKAVIEPYLSKQWFVKMSPFIPKLQNAVLEKRLKILPKIWESTYFHWIDNLRDWCISRQLWWGHRIPVWYRKDQPDQMLCYAGEGLPPEVEHSPEMWEQDADVLDTWFSSALWPFSTLGWPQETADLKKFYPTNVLVTGHDILFFWVARMILMGEYALDQLPFPETFLHGLIYGKSYWRKNSDGSISYLSAQEKKEYDMGKTVPSDVHSKWEKLSKSKGNVIDPLDLITEYGTDAVRMALCSCANQTPQIDLDRRRFEEFKNFANKIWNGARFVFKNLEDLSSEELSAGLDESCLCLEDLWILSALNRINTQIHHHLTSYAFDAAATLAYEFFWKEFCAYYLEISKPYLFHKSGDITLRKNKQKLLVVILCNMIRLLHPMAPFITEELFQILKKHFSSCTKKSEVDPYTQATVKALEAPACIVAPYPELIRAADIQPHIEKRFAYLEEIIYAIRNIRGEMNIPPNVAISIYLVGDFNESLEILKALIKTEKIELNQEIPTSEICATAVVGSLKIFVPLPAALAEKELSRLQKEKEKNQQSVDKLKQLLANPEFQKKAQPELIQKQTCTLNELETQLKILVEKIKALDS